MKSSLPPTRGLSEQDVALAPTPDYGVEDESGELPIEKRVREAEDRLARVQALHEALVRQVEEARRQWDADCRVREQQRREEEQRHGPSQEHDRRMREEQERRILSLQAENDRFRSQEAERLMREEQDRRIRVLQAENDRLRSPGVDTPAPPPAPALAAVPAPAAPQPEPEPGPQEDEVVVALPVESGPQDKADVGPRPAEPRPPKGGEIAPLRTAEPRHAAKEIAATRSAEPRYSHGEASRGIEPIARPAASGAWRDQLAQQIRKLDSRLEKQFADLKQFEDMEPPVEPKRPGIDGRVYG